MNVQRWWSSIAPHQYPAWGGPLMSFMTPVISLFNGILPAGVRCAWSLDIDSACADRDNNRLLLSTKLISDNAAVRINKEADKPLAMACVLGTQLHEIGHFLYSPKKIPDLIPAGVKLSSGLAAIANIMEDIYIETRLIKAYPDLAWTLKAGSWEYFFSLKGAQKAHTKWDGKQPVDSETFTNAVNALVGCWRRYEDVPSHGEYEDGLRELAMSIVGMDSLEHRQNLIMAVVEYLGLPTSSSDDEEDGEGEGEGSGQGEGGGQGNGGSFVEVQADGDAEFKPISGNAAPKNPFVFGSLEAPETMKFKDFDAGESMPIVVRNNQEVDSSREIPLVREWDKLAQLEKDAATARRIPGPSGYTGRLTDPARMFSDGRMFSNNTLEAADGTAFSQRVFDIILVVDRSGSMSMGGKWERASVAAANMARALATTGARVLVATHHTEEGMAGPGSSEACIIQIVKGFNESYSNTVNRFKALVSGRADGGNADADAISYLAKQFPRGNGTQRKVMIVISDGAPACGTYCGYSGRIKTNKAVTAVRKSGVQVYSISIDESAAASNDEIYGAAYNINNSDPNVAAQLLKRLMTAH